MKKWKNKWKRTAAIFLAALLVGNTPDLSVVYAAPAEDTAVTKEITAFAELADEVCEQTISVGDEEGDIILPDSLRATVAEAVSGSAASINEEAIEVLRWEIDADNSDSAVFVSDESAEGYAYTYVPVLAGTDAEGNEITLAENVDLPEIYVLVGERQPMLLAAEETKVTVAGTALYTETYYKTENGTVTTVGADEDDFNVYLIKEDDRYVLTLKNAEVEAETDGIYYNGYLGNLPLEMVITGSNQVKATGGSSSASGWAAAIWVDGQSLTISGTGTLTAIADTDETYALYENYGSAGIYAVGTGADISIKSGTVYAIAGEADVYSNAIVATEDINITGGTVYANYLLEDGVLVPTGGGANPDSSCGMRSENNDSEINIAGGTVYAYGGEGENGSCGIYTAGTVVISGGTVKAVGGDADMTSAGIGSLYDIEITGGTVEATGGAANNASYGIGGDNVNISGDADVDAAGGDVVDGESHGIGAVEKLSISGDAEVNAKGGSVENGESFGMGASGGSEISGDAEVNAEGGNVGTGNSYGMGTDGESIIKDKAEVNTKGGNVETGNSFGMGVDEIDSANPAKLTIEGNAKVNATGGVAKNSIGAGVNGELFIKGTDGDTPQVTAAGSNAEEASVGMLVTGDTELDDAKVDVTGNEATNGVSYALAGEENVTIKNTKMTAKSGTAGSGNSDAIGAEGNLIIENSEITAEGGVAKNGDSHGLASYKDIKISNSSKIEAKAGAASNDSLGIGSEQNIEINTSKIFSEGNTAGRRSFGIGALGRLDMSDSQYRFLGDTVPIGAAGGVNMNNCTEISDDNDDDDDNDDYDDSDDYDYDYDDDDDSKKVILPYGQWKQDAIGWWYQYTAGGYPAGSIVVDAAGTAHEIVAWDFIDGAWWAFGADGYADFGWIYDITLNGWFYVDGSTGMKTGWQFINEKWYYLNPLSDGTKGKLYTNTITPDGYAVDENGAWIQ